MIEALSEMDEEIIEKFLACDADHFRLSSKDIKESLRKMTLAGRCVPTLCGAAFRNLGIQPLMDSMIDYLPSPENVPLPDADMDSDKLCALAFKVLDDEKRGPLVFVRVYSGKICFLQSGSITPRSVLKNNTQNVRENVGRCLQMYADEYEEIPNISAGNIAAVSGLKVAQTGDTLSAWNDKSDICLFPLSKIPHVITRSIKVDSHAEEKKMIEALSILKREDPSVHVSTDEETGELLISGMGELHLEICAEKLRKRHKLSFSEGPVSVSYRQTVVDNLQDQYVLFEKTILGNDIKIGFEFDLSPVKVYSGQIIPPSSTENKVELLLDKHTIFIGNEPLYSRPSKSAAEVPKHDVTNTSVLQGIRNSLERYSSERHPFINTHVTLKKLQLINGYPFTEGILRMASYVSLNNLLDSIPNILLEPAMKLDIQVKDTHIKAISKDLINFRSGHILALDDSSSGELKRLIAMVPVSRIQGYSSHFRSLTKGKGRFSYSMEGYTPKLGK
jgi:elongation factor G